MLHLLWDALRRTCYCMIGFLAFLLLTPNLPPYDIEFYRGSQEPPNIPFTGGLTPNHRLETAEPLSRSFKGSSSIGFFKGAESFAVKDGYLYTGIHGGDIVRLQINAPKQPWEYVTKIGELCTDLHQEEICGRILGLEFDPKGRLYLCDAYYGLYRVDLNKGGEIVPLVPANVVIDGKRNLITNSLAISKDGKTIYYTVSSTNFVLHNGMYESLTSPSGRVLKYDVYGNISKVIMDEISFANGIALAPNEEYFIVAETGDFKLWKYWLKGDKRGQKEIFVQTPGYPDNIKLSPEGNFIVGIVLPHKEGYSGSYLQGMLTNPILAKLSVRLCCLAQTIIQSFINNVFYVNALAVMNYRLGNTEYSGVNLVPNYGLVVEYDHDGHIVQSWHSDDPMITKICEGFVHLGQMYLGSPYNPQLLKIPYSN